MTSRSRDPHASILGPAPIWNGKVVTVPVRRMVGLYVGGVVIGVLCGLVGGIAIAWLLWGLSL